MSANNIDVYMPIIILMAFGTVTLFAALLVGRLVRTQVPSTLKEQAYECGEDPVGTAWANFNVRFYVVSLIFIIFDVEGALMFPVASVFRDFVEMGEGTVVLASFTLFVAILVAGVAYCWSKGDLDWVKSFRPADEKQG